MNTNSTTSEDNMRVQPSILVMDGYGGPLNINDKFHSIIVGWKFIVLQNCPGTIVENLVFNDGTTILLVNCDDVIVRNNTLMDAKSYALFVEYSDNVLIENNVINGGTNDGLISYQNSNVIIRNNLISGTVKNGIYAQGSNTTVSSNSIKDIDGSGIYITSSPDVLVSNNTIENVTWAPIAADESSMQGNYINNTYNGLIYTDIGEIMTSENLASSSDTSNTLSENYSEPPSSGKLTSKTDGKLMISMTPIIFSLIGIFSLRFIREEK